MTPIVAAGTEVTETLMAEFGMAERLDTHIKIHRVRAQSTNRIETTYRLTVTERGVVVVHEEDTETGLWDFFEILVRQVVERSKR